MGRILRIEPRCQAARTVGIAFLALLITMPTAASEPARLTRDGTRKLAPTFVDGGAALVYAAHERPNLVALVQLDWQSGSCHRVLPKLVNHQFDPAVTAQGRYLAYCRTTTSPQSELVIRDLHEQRDVTFRPRDSRATVRHPSVAPDGSRVVFSLSDLGGQQIATVNLKGQDLMILAASAGLNGWPSYAPDGQHIAFTSSRDGDLELYVMDAAGNHLRRLTRSPGRDLQPAWSPDGKQIAFTSARDDNEEIYLIDADGSNPRNLTRHPDRDTEAAWHPDGRRLAFISDRGGQCDLYLIELGRSRPAESGSR